MWRGRWSSAQCRPSPSGQTLLWPPGVGSEERRDFDEIQNLTNALLAECSHQLVEFRLLAGDVVSTEASLRQSKPAGWLVAPEGRQFDVAETRRRIKLDEIFFVLSHDEKSANLTFSKTIQLTTD